MGATRTILARGATDRAARRLGLLVLGLAALGFLAHAADVALHGFERDFSTRYAAAEIAHHGGNPYSAAVLHPQEIRQAGGPVPYYPEDDPPPTVALFRALQILSLVDAQRVWFALTVVAVLLLALGVVRIVRAASIPVPATRAAAWVAVPIAFAASPVQQALQLDQLDPVYVLPFVAATLLLARERSLGTTGWRTTATAALCVLSVLKPQTTLLPAAFVGLVSFRTSHFRAALGAGSACAVLALGSWALAPSATWGRWVRAAEHQSDSTSPALRAGLLLLAGVGAVVTVRAVRALPTALDWPQGVVICCAAEGLFSGVVRWNAQWHLLLCVPAAAAVLAARSGAAVRSTRDRLALAIAAGLLLGDGLTTPAWVSGTETHAVAAILAVALLLAGLVLLHELPARWYFPVLGVNALASALPLDLNAVRVWGLASSVLLGWLLPRLFATAAGGGPAIGASGSDQPALARVD